MPTSGITQTRMVFTPTLNITEQIADHLANLIIHGDLAGGARIQELKIANELGVSRGSVREALLILERRHLIEIVPRKGAVVNDLAPEEALELVEMLASIEHKWFRNLMKNRNLDEVLKVAAQALLEMDRAAKGDDLPLLVSARDGFYGALLSPANRYMSGVFDCLFPTSQRLLCALVDRADVDLHDIARYYRAVFDALQTANDVRLEELLTAFNRRIQNLCAKAIAAPGKATRQSWSVNARVYRA